MCWPATSSRRRTRLVCRRRFWRFSPLCLLKTAQRRSKSTRLIRQVAAVNLQQLLHRQPTRLRPALSVKRKRTVLGLGQTKIERRPITARCIGRGKQQAPLTLHQRRAGSGVVVDKQQRTRSLGRALDAGGALLRIARHRHINGRPAHWWLMRSEEHTSELQSQSKLVSRLL